MLRNQNIWVSLGVAIGLVVSGLTGTMSWTILGMIMIAYLVLSVIIPPKYADKNPHVVSVGFWIAVGMVTISVLVWIFRVSEDIYGMALIAWLILSVILGVFWPLSIAKRQINGGG